MNPQILVLGVAQAFRAAITALLPITLVTLFGWASAGSGTGNTGDALRGSGMFWLGAHHALFSLRLETSDVVGKFWFLPIGLLIIPYLTLHGSGLRIARELKEMKDQRVESLLLASISLSFVYAVLVALVAGLVRTSAVAPNPLVAFVAGLVAAVAFGVPRILRLGISDSLISLWLAVRSGLVALFGLGVVAVLASLVVNYQEVWDITSVLRLGLISGIFVLLISIVYLPNLAIWAVAYFSGIGFGFGKSSSVSPFGTDIGSIPAFPLFAAIPAQPPGFAVVLPIVVLIAFAVVGFKRFRVLEFRESIQPGLQVAAVVVVVALVAAFFSGGPMVGGNLSAVGPSLWKFPLLVGLESFVGVVIGSTARILLDRARPSQRLRRV